jgi:hypothetical protein
MPAVGRTETRWQGIYEYLRRQPHGTVVSWRVLVEVAGFDIRASRSALLRAKQEMALVDGMGIGNQTPAGIEVVKL